MTLTELLVVFAIIAILAALYLPALMKAVVRVKHFVGGCESSDALRCLSPQASHPGKQANDE